MMVDEIEYDTEVQCRHVSHKTCFETYETNFKESQVSITIFLLKDLALHVCTVHKHLYFTECFSHHLGSRM